jgi:uncharacterized protein (DUF169 family)
MCTATPFNGNRTAAQMIAQPRRLYAGSPLKEAPLMAFPELARDISAVLGLENPPVALTFVDEAPAGVPTATQAVPSACSFWREAEKGTFFASAEQHNNCPIGAMVMGFALPEEVQTRLGELVTGMCDAGYLAADEPAAIPGVKARHAGIVYGPLAEAAAPDVALIWVTPQQAMLCNEAMGAANWTTPAPTTTGRPGCAALPMAMNEDTPTLSLGCAGMRTFTGIGADRMLVAVPGSKVEQFVAALQQTSAVNAQMLSYYEGQRDQFAPVSGG